MKYFFDTEFCEGTQKTRKEKFLIAIIIGICGGISSLCYTTGKYYDMAFFVAMFFYFIYLYGKAKDKTPNTIDLISIGIVSEDVPAFSNRIGKSDRTFSGRQYYAISKDFNLKEAWNRCQIKDTMPDTIAHGKIKVYWIRENVLMPIFADLCNRDGIDGSYFTYKLMKRLLKKYGKTNKQIAKEIERFVYNPESVRPMGTEEPIEFYAYFADYDWVVFSWLFGKMIDLPKGFPMYCRDLKQMLDETYDDYYGKRFKDVIEKLNVSQKEKLSFVKNLNNYPKQENEHNALDDAKWNKKLYEFITNLK